MHTWPFDEPRGEQTVDDLWTGLQLVHSEQEQFDRDVARDGDALVLTHSWWNAPCWYAYDAVHESETLTLTTFGFDAEHKQYTARVEPTGDSGDNPWTPVPLQRFVDVCRQYHPFDVETVTAADIEFKCGDVTPMLAVAMRYELNIPAGIVQGGIYNPETGEGWSHAYNVIDPAWTTDTDDTVFLDGTAKQFCDGPSFPQSLGAEADIDGLHVVGPNHPHRPYYATSHDQFTGE
jgi:hypothetical protein